MLQFLFTVYFLSSRDTSEDSYALFSRTTRTQQHATAVDAIVVGGVLLPHGDFALDPSFFANGTVERDVANDVAKGSRRAGRWLAELQQKQKQPRGAYYQKTIHPRETKNETRCGSDCYVADDEEPLIVLMTTPHGIKLDYDYGIYVSSRGSGSATIGGDCIGFRDNALGYNIGRERKIRNRKGVVSKESWSNATKQHGRHPCQHKPYNVTLQNIDLAPTALAKDLLTFLHQEKKHPVSGVYSYDDETPIPLNWGEIVPLLLLPTTPHASATTASSVSSTSSKILPLIWTFPYRRYNHSVDMVPELLQVGADIMDWAQQRPERIAILVSGDLSHTHQSDGPYGYSAASGPYDDTIGRWAGGHDNNNDNDNGISEGSRRHSWDPCQLEATAALLNRAKELQPDAKSCGFIGYVMWHGMMCPTSSTTAPPLSLSLSMTSDVSAKPDNDSQSNNIIMKKDRPIKFDSKVFVNRNVTYYGMIGAIFEPYYVGEDGNGIEIDIGE